MSASLFHLHSALARHEITDEQFAQVAHLLPSKPTDQDATARDTCLFIAAVLPCCRAARIAERTFAWLQGHRRCSKDYVQLPEVSEAMVQLVASVYSFDPQESYQTVSNVPAIVVLGRNETSDDRQAEARRHIHVLSQDCRFGSLSDFIANKMSIQTCADTEKY